MPAFGPRSRRPLLLAGLTGLLLGGASPALRAQAQAEAPQERACRTEVSKFEETISFLRHTQGMEAAAKLKEELLPAKLESEILMQQGYCGLARHLRDKHLL